MLEVRQLTVTGQRPTQRVPAHLPPGCSAVCCDFSTPNGATAQVVLGGPLEGTLYTCYSSCAAGHPVMFGSLPYHSSQIHAAGVLTSLG